jgi:hypothetical protein
MAHDTEVPAFSTIKFFSAFERKLKAYDVFPLVPQNLVIQQDAYKRMGNHDEDAEQDEFFAEFEYGHKTQDSDIRFGIQFAAEVFQINIEGVPSSISLYSDCFEDEADAVKQIMTTLQLLASGQLAVLMTERDDYRCASELLLFQAGNPVPTVLLTQADYPRSWKKKDEDNYETMLLRNAFINRSVTPPKTFFMADRNQAGNIESRGRVFESADLTPLTKRMYHAALEESLMRQSGRRPGESDAALMMRSPEYWLMLIVVFGLLYGGVALHILPVWVGQLPIVVLPIFMVLVVLVLLPLLARKEHLKAYHPDHWWVRVDTWFATAIVAPVQRSLKRVVAIWRPSAKKGKK